MIRRRGELANGDDAANDLRSKEPQIVQYIERMLNSDPGAVQALCEYVLRPVGGLLSK